MSDAVRTRLLGIVGAVVLLGGTAMATGVASAAPQPIDTRVTIRAVGTELSGQVKSPSPNRCARGRLVVVMRQIGARGGGNDIRFATDTAEFQDGAIRWSTGNTGRSGRFYAKVFKTDRCRGATSATIQVTNPS